MFSSFQSLILSGVSLTSIALSVFAGIATFLSPCILPLLPIYFSYLASSPINQLQSVRKRLIMRSLCFVLGFSLVFLILGASMIGLISIFFNQPLFIIFNQPIFFYHIAGIVVIIFGLQLCGILRLSWLERDTRLLRYKQSQNIFGALLLGIFFGLGWSPCIGPLLSSIILLASVERDLGITLLLCYTIGLGIPFVISALFISKALSFINKQKAYLEKVQKIAAILLIVMGILMLIGSTNLLSAMLVNLYTTN